MRRDPEGTVHGLYTAWSLRDIDATLAYCHDDVGYHIVASGGSGHRAHLVGLAAVRAHLEAVCAVWQWEPSSILPGPFVVEGNVVIREQFSFRARHRRSGLELSGTRRHVWRVAEGRVTCCTEHLDGGALEAFLRMAEACRTSPAIGMPLLAYSSFLAGLAGIV